MKLDISKFEKAKAIPAIKVAEKYEELVKACAYWSVEASLILVPGHGDENIWGERYSCKAEVYEEIACGCGELLGFTHDDTHGFINHEIDARTPEGCKPVGW